MVLTGTTLSLKGCVSVLRKTGGTGRRADVGERKQPQFFCFPCYSVDLLKLVYF